MKNVIDQIFEFTYSSRTIGKDRNCFLSTPIGEFLINDNHIKFENLLLYIRKCSMYDYFWFDIFFHIII